jgi:hypothetical protein
MRLTTKIGLGFVAAGLIVGVLISSLGLQGYKTLILVVLGGLCFVTLFAISYRERTKQAAAPKSVAEQNIQK